MADGVGVRAATVRPREGAVAGRRNSHARNVERLKQVLRLRLQGHTFAAIAEKLGYTDAPGAYRAYRAALEWAEVEELATDLVKTEVLRLDMMLKALINRIAAGDPRAVEVAVKVVERKAKLLGLDAPEKKLVKGQFENIESRVSGVTPEYTAAVLRELAQTNPRALQMSSEEGKKADAPSALDSTERRPGHSGMVMSPGTEHVARAGHA